MRKLTLAGMLIAIAGCLYGQGPIVDFRGLNTPEGFRKALKSLPKQQGNFFVINQVNLETKCSIPLLSYPIPKDQKFAARILPEVKTKDPMPKAQVPAPPCK